MRALAHPVRLALLELLGREGAANATQAAQRLGASQASCSYHLRELARFGFVEEVTDTRGRARPWRLAVERVRVGNVQADPDAQAAWRVLERMLGARELARYRRWLHDRETEPVEWQEAAFHSRRVVWLTAEELAGVSEQLEDLVRDRYAERRDDPTQRPAGARAVELLSLGYPTEPTAG